jgi:hypothetical protein
VTYQQIHVNKIYFIVSYVTIQQNVSVASAAIIWVLYKNTNNMQIHAQNVKLKPPDVTVNSDGFGGLVVSMQASGTRVRGFKPGRSRWISSACLPSEGK